MLIISPVVILKLLGEAFPAAPGIDEPNQRVVCFGFFVRRHELGVDKLHGSLQWLPNMRLFGIILD